MSYTVNFYNKKSIVVTDEQGEKVKDAKMSGNVENIEIGDNLYSVANISTIEKGGVLPDSLEPVKEIFGIIDEPNPCKGRFSIHKELMMIAKSENKVPMLKKDSPEGKTWREEVKAKLYETTDKWCDYTKGKCFCYGDAA